MKVELGQDCIEGRGRQQCVVCSAVCVCVCVCVCVRGVCVLGIDRYIDSTRVVSRLY